MWLIPIPLPERSEGVAELVQEDRAEEQEGRWRSPSSVGSIEPSAGSSSSRIEVGQEDDDQEEDQEPGPVDRDPDSPDRRECVVAAAHPDGC